MKSYELGPSLDAYLELESAAVTLHDFLRERAAAEVYRIPLFRDDGEAGSSTRTSYVSSAPVPVERLTGTAALVAGTGIYKQFLRRKNQPPRSADRLPGVVVLQDEGDARELREMALELNRLKDALKAEVSRLPRLSARGSELFAGTDLQHVFLVQAYRHIVVAPEGVDRISFGWDRRNRVINRVPRQDLIQKLLERSDAGVSKWVDRLRERGGEFVAVARERGPVPFAWARRDEAWLPRMPASMPVIVAGDSVEVIPLESYEPPDEERRRRPPNPGKLALSPAPVIPELGVYEYECE